MTLPSRSRGSSLPACIKLDDSTVADWIPLTSPRAVRSLSLFSLLPNPRDPSITTRLRSANKFPRLPSRTKNIRHLFSMLCLTIRLHRHSAIILVLCSFFKNFIHFFDCSCTYQFIHCIVYCFLFVSLPCVVLFSLMATRLNKHYYYYYYYYSNWALSAAKRH